MQDKIETFINEVRQEICISGVGDKASLDMAIGGRLRLKNELETNSFEKVFGIPDGVALDQIEVCFDEEDAILMILMPKSTNMEGEVHERASGKVDEGELNRNGLETDTHRKEDEETKKEEVDESNKKFDLPQRPSIEIEAPNIREQLPPSFGVKANGSGKVDEDEVNRNGSEADTHREEDEEMKNEEVDESNKKFDLPQRPLVEIEASSIGEQLSPSFGFEPKGEQQQIEEEKHNGQPLKEDESPRTSEVNQALNQPKISPSIDKEQEDKKGGVGKSHELDNKLIDEKGPPQQLNKELETGNKDKLPMKEVKGEVDQRETREIDKEREASEVNQTLGHPKIHQHIDKEHQEEQEKHDDKKRDVAEEQIRVLPRQRIEELETIKKDELSTKEMKGKRRRKEQRGLGVPPPSLVVSAFLLSLAALVIKLVRNQKRT
ncbi:calponin homology domain-containing protein DDB_G0272472-like [Zingiber officinale]|uniref:calponin homology domain-containing protein DDB_G0272472-like n=1 Tax=Zingiber officinale TaxID=94328 RepID=UPI001C4D74D1|nr:calponin homology domain-containing protein DDB_G0272472-like [Zingiber officinale]